MRTLNIFWAIRVYGLGNILRHILSPISAFLSLLKTKICNPYNLEFQDLVEKHIKLESSKAEDVSRLLRNTFCLLGGFRDKKRTVELWKELFKSKLSNIKQKADKICQGELLLLNRSLKLSESIDWQYDPTSNRRYDEKRFYKFIKLKAIDAPRDYKLVWELNRHQYFITLGKAFWLTGDEKYAMEFVRHLEGWIENNKILYGANWKSSLEVAIRLISWTLGFYFFQDSESFDDDRKKKFVVSLYQQTRFLYRNLSTDWVVPNNHLIGEASALIVMGAAFSFFDESRDWLKKGVRILEEAIRGQVSPDGVSREQAMSYHRLVMDFVTVAYLAVAGKSLPEDSVLRTSLEKMTEFVKWTVGPDGKCAYVGDTDGARGFFFDEDRDFWDFRDSLSTGAVIFKRKDFKYTSGGYSKETLWLLGPESYKLFLELESAKPEQRVICFREGGFYFKRNDWSDSDDFLLFKCGQLGLGGDGYCGHGHCDLLSFILYLGGRQFLVDSGTYSYCSDLRNYFRVTRAHNTVKIDGKEQAIPWGDFGWKRPCKAQLVDWSEQSVEGRLKIKVGVTFHRRISSEELRCWIIKDRFLGQGKRHSLEWNFHFASEFQPRLLEDRVELRGDDILIDFYFPLAQSQAEILEKEGSTYYGRKDNHKCLQLKWQGELGREGRDFVWKIKARRT